MGAMKNLHMDTEAQRLREENERLRGLLVIAEIMLTASYAATGIDADASPVIRQIRAANEEQS